MKQAQPVAPKERINISYRPNEQTTEEKELPLKFLVLSELTPRNQLKPLSERKPVRIDRYNFDDVLKGHDIELSLTVKNRIKPADETLGVTFKPTSMKDFQPGQLIEKIPPLKQLLELRNALTSLKGPLGNVPAFRKRLQQIIRDPETRTRLLAELKLPTGE